MGTWLPLILAVIKAVAAVASYLSDRKLLEAGKAEALIDGLTLTLNNVEKANDAARAVDPVSSDFDSGFAERVRQRFERKPGSQ